MWRILHDALPILAIEEESWYEENKIYQILGRTVVSVDAAQKEVKLDDGTVLQYGRLVYALGSECFIPPVTGHDKPEVIAIRRLSDTEKIASLLPDIKQVAVIGGGVLGLEAAWELKKAKCDVTVLEAAPQLMGRQLDESGSSMIKDICESHGIRVYTGVNIQEIEGGEHVTGVYTLDRKSTRLNSSHW